jgi:hypothetical protein
MHLRKGDFMVMKTITVDVDIDIYDVFEAISDRDLIEELEVRGIRFSPSEVNDIRQKVDDVYYYLTRESSETRSFELNYEKALEILDSLLKHELA